MPRPLLPRTLSFEPIRRALRDRERGDHSADVFRGAGRGRRRYWSQILTVCEPFVPVLDQTLAEWLGVSLRSVKRWDREGLHVYQADKIAVLLGFHPAELWGDEFYAAPGDEERAA